MRRDLLEAQACVDWTIAQLPTFRAKIDAWAANNLEVIIRELEPPAENDVVVARPKEPVPVAFNVEAGAYINTLRSGLDILATALGRRHMVLNPDNIYFPVADSAERFAAGDYKGSELVKALGADDGLILKALKPYQGGHNVIWPLHQLDIHRKHKRLLTVAIIPISLRTSWRGPRSPGFIHLNNVEGFIRSNDEAILGLFSKGATDRQVEASLQITFDEPWAADSSVVPTLERYAASVGEIIRAFDY